MILNNDDIAAIKKALQPEFVRIDKRFVSIDKRIASLSQKIVSLERKTEKRFVSLEKKIDQLRIDTALAIGNIAEKVAVQSDVNELRGRVTSLEYLQKTAHITKSFKQ